MTAPIATKPATKPDTLQPGSIIHTKYGRTFTVLCAPQMEQFGRFFEIVGQWNDGMVRRHTWPTIRRALVSVEHGVLTPEQEEIVLEMNLKMQKRQAWLEWLAEEEEPLHLRDEIR